MAATDGSTPARGGGGPVGLIPAAGQASRLSRLPCSKEIYPVGFEQDAHTSAPRPKAACQYLLEGMRTAGAKRAYLVLGAGKWDIPAYLRDGEELGIRLAYLLAWGSPGVPYTLTRATPFLAEDTVLFGFPDIVFSPADAFVRLLSRQEATGADVVLGLFLAERAEKVDMVGLATDGTVERIVIKPARTELTDTWLMAAWTPRFTEFLEAFADRAYGPDAEPAGEVHLGDVFQAAVEQGWRLETVRFPDGRYRDIGTPDDLAAAVAEGPRPR